MAWDDLANDELPSGREINEAIVATTIPAGVTPSLHTDAIIPQPGAIITATWTHPGAATGLLVFISWEVNGKSYQGQTLSPGTTTADLNTSGLSAGDEIRAAISYGVPSGSLVGVALPYDDDIHSNSARNAGLLLNPPLGPTSDCASKEEILNAAVTRGVGGNLSHTITLS